MAYPFSFLTQSAKQTHKLGQFLASEIAQFNQTKRRSALILSLEGDLGSGKTTFVQGLAKGLGIKQKVLSPSFLIIKGFGIKAIRPRNPPKAESGEGRFSLPDHKAQSKQGFKRFFHIDLYRIKKPRELLRLDFKDILKDPKNIVAIEWGKKTERLLPKRTLRIRFEHVSAKVRRISLGWN